MKLVIFALLQMIYLVVVLGRDYKTFSDDELNTSNVEALYKEYLTHHPHKKYAHDSAEGKRRLVHFKKNLEKLKLLRAQLKKRRAGWEANLNAMSDISEEEMNSMNGHRTEDPDTKRLHRNLPNRKANSKKSSKLKMFLEKRVSVKVGQLPFYPQQINWTSVFLPVRNQAACGSCWTFSTTGALEANYAIKNPTWQKKYFSTQQLVSCRYATPTGCNGGEPTGAMNFLNTTGIVADSNFPYYANATACFANGTLPLEVPVGGIPTISYCHQGGGLAFYTYYNGTAKNGWMTGMCQESDLYALLQRGPVSVSIDGTAIGPYRSGIFDNPCSVSNHAVILVGYGFGTDANGNNVDYWIVRNSWSATWGEGGYIRVKRNLDNHRNCFMTGWFQQPQF